LRRHQEPELIRLFGKVKKSYRIIQLAQRPLSHFIVKRTVPVTIRSYINGTSNLANPAFLIYQGYYLLKSPVLLRLRDYYVKCAILFI